MSLIFIAIPKTSGQALTKSLSQNKHVFNFGHSTCLSPEFISRHCKYKWDSHLLTIPNLVFTDSIKFTIIRNPFDWLVSYFVSRWGDFDNGVLEKLPKRTVQDLIRMYCTSIGDWHVPLLQKFIYSQLFDDNGVCMCDYAIIYDRREEGIQELCDKFNLIYRPVRVNHTLNKKAYKKYYTPELIAMVYEKCVRELNMFNFDFNGYNGSRALLHIKDIHINWRDI